MGMKQYESVVRDYLEETYDSVETLVFEGRIEAHCIKDEPYTVHWVIATLTEGEYRNTLSFMAKSTNSEESLSWGIGEKYVFF